jgi:hypothetical protein
VILRRYLPKTYLTGYNFDMTEQKAQELQEKKDSELHDTNDRARAVFELAEAKTKSSQLEWRASDSDEVYSASTPNGFILKMYPFTSFENNEPVGPPSLTVYDNAEKLIFDITQDVVKSDRLGNLYQLVKYRAERTAEKLQMIIEDLSALA